MAFEKGLFKKPSDETHYDYHRIVTQLRKENKHLTFSDFIDDKIKRHQRNLQDGIHGNQDNYHFGRKELAKILSCDYETLKKIINGTQKTRKRDLIIAICAALEMNTSETDCALILYEMLPLYNYNDRDLVIIQALTDRAGFEGLNRELKACGFSELHINRKKGGLKKMKDSDYYYPNKNDQYTVVSRKVVPFPWLPENDISGRYFIGNFDYDTEMVLKDPAGQKILLKTWSSDSHEIYSFNKNGILDTLPLFSDIFQENDFDSLPDELKFRFKELDYLRDKKAREVYNILNDTRNYGLRVDASYIDGSLLFYGECFNQDNPELSEYCQLKLFDGTAECSLTHHSLFMHHLLGEKAFQDLYDDLPAEEPIILPNMISDKHKLLEADNTINPKRLLPFFNRLLSAIDDLLARLKAKEVYIFDAYTDCNSDDLMKIFKVEQAFECIPSSEEYYELAPQKDFILDENGEPVTIDDLYRALELGLGSIHDISIVRKKHGSLEGILIY